MAKIRAFRGYRPRKDIAQKIASRPYDVLSSKEAAGEAAGNPFSFYHVIKSEIDLPQDVDQYSPLVYQKAKENLEKFISDGILVQDKMPCLYIYAQTMGGRIQYGLVACASVADYQNNFIKKHELTRTEKEIDRKTHIRVTNFNTEPVFFAYPAHGEIDMIVASYVKEAGEYDFVADDGIRHQLWVISDPSVIGRIETIFRTEITYTYIADGHHRTAAAAHIGQEKKMAAPGHKGDEEYNFFLAVHFPANQLAIMDYNRVVKDLNGLTREVFLEILGGSFIIDKKGSEPYKPSKAHEFSLYIEKEWYSLNAKEGICREDDPIGCLDVTVLYEQVLAPVLDIKDLRSSHRIDFVGGIRGLNELKRRVDSGEMAAAFALYPVSMDQLIRIADTDNIMPPKVTWFEPKLRSGLVLHSLE